MIDIPWPGWAEELALVERRTTGEEGESQQVLYIKLAAFT